ncbi:MAG: carboxypeptidase regulatory-like domain-containing protein [Chloroflexi bacterium]|nr:carboxypeptidase regulatory-like domain-containing protein [Chloroflexota bacterium]
MRTKIWLLIVPVLVLGTVFCSTTPAPPTPTPDVAVLVEGTLQALTAEALPPTTDVDALVQGTMQALTAQAASAPVSTDTPPPPATGSIAGDLSYPSEVIPPLRVAAFNVDTGQVYYVDTVMYQGDYQIDNLPPGTYHVVAYVSSGTGFPAGLGGGYSQMVPCGLAYGCDDHSLLDVVVTAGQVTSNIDPGDWYAPDGSWPPMP